MFGLAGLVGGLGRVLGGHSSVALQRLRLGPLDSGFGAVVAVVATLVAAWLVGSIVVNSRYSYNRFIRFQDQNQEALNFDLTSLGFPSSYAGLIGKYLIERLPEAEAPPAAKPKKPAAKKPAPA